MIYTYEFVIGLRLPRRQPRCRCRVSASLAECLCTRPCALYWALPPRARVLFPLLGVVYAIVLSFYEYHVDNKVPYDML